VFGLAAKAFVNAYDGYLRAEIKVGLINFQIQGVKDRRKQNQIFL
jgi:hypothetical protein